MQQLVQGHWTTIFMRLTVGQETRKWQRLGIAETGCTLSIIVFSMAMMPTRKQIKKLLNTGVNNPKKELLK